MAVMPARTAFLIVFVACASAIAFANTLTYGFVWDDHFLISNSHLIRDWSSLPTIFTTHFWAGHADWRMYYRPLINATFLLDFQIWGLNPLGYHLTNMLLHAAASMAVLWVASLLLKDWLTSFAAAALFALHPVHSQSVSFIAGRTDVTSTLFVLLAVGAYLRWRDSGRAIGWYVAALAAATLALLAKETAIALPILLLAHEWCAREGTPRAWLRRAARAVAPILALMAGVMTLRLMLLGDELVAGVGDAPHDLGRRLLTAIQIVSWYGWVTLVPYPVSPSQTRDFVASAGDPGFIVAAAGLMVLVAATVLAIVRSRRAGFATLWFWIALAPSASLLLLPATVPIAADRFLYLPSVGVCLLLAVGLGKLAGEAGELGAASMRRAPMVSFAVVLVTFAVLTLWRNEYWKDDLRLYYRMADTDPQSLTATLNLALVHLNRREAGAAERQLERARAIAPDNSRVLVSYGMLRAETGHPDEGLELALRGLRYEFREPSLHALVGRIYSGRGEHDKASAHYREAARLQPHAASHYFPLAYALYLAGHIPQAARAYEEGVERARAMKWHQPLVDRWGGEIYAKVDPARAITYWERYAVHLRGVPQPGDLEKQELADAERELRKLRGAAG